MELNYIVFCTIVSIISAFLVIVDMIRRGG